MHNNSFKACRLRKGYSQKYVAISLQVAAPSVCAWESGKSDPSVENLKKLAALYEVTVDELLGLSPNDSPPPSIADDVRAAFIQADPITQENICAILHVPHPQTKTETA